jgi:hypothetical protein
LSKQVPIGQILTEEQIKHCCKLLLQENPIQHLKEYFNSIAPQLQEKGILPEYLAYAFLHAVHNSQAPDPLGLHNFRN